MSEVQHAPVAAKTPPAPQPTTTTATPGTAAPGPSNADAEKQATLARAVGAITTEWKTACGALLLPGKPTEPTPDKFRAAAYPLIARLDGTGQTGLIGVKLAFSVLDDRKEWVTALAAAEGDAQQDTMHRAVIHGAIEDLVHGGDIQFNSQRIIGHFQMTSDGGRSWWQGQEALPWTGALAAYLGNKTLLETHVGYSGVPMFEAMYSGQADLRANLIRPLLVLLKTGAIEARPGDTGPAMPPSPSEAQTAQWDHQALALRKKVEPHLPQLGATKIDGLGGHERRELLSAVSDAPLEVRDRLALDTTFMRRVALLGELMKLQTDAGTGVASGQSLFRALDPVEALFDDVSGRSQITTGKQYIGMNPKTGAERFDRIAGYMAMHVKPDDQPLRMRVVAHPGMLDSLEDPQKANLWRLATRGTMQPGIEDRLYPAVKSGDATGAARVLLSANGDDRAAIAKLQADVMFRSAIATDAMRQQVALDGVAVRPYDLVLVMWGQRPGSTKDLGQTGVVEDDPNADQAPLNFDDRRKLDGMYNGTVDVLQNDLSAADAWLFAGARTSDSDVVAHLEHFATQCASKDYVGLIRRAGTPPGQELATRYNAKTGKSIQTLIKNGCGEDARRTAERILNITVDSASLGTVGGTGSRAGDRGPGALITLEQALRETTVEPSGGDTISQRVHAAAHELKEELHPGWFSHVDPTHAEAIFGLLDAQLDMPGSSRLDEIKRLTGRKVYTIELLQNAYMEIDGSLAETIANKAREDDVQPILNRLGLNAGAIAKRAKATEDAAAKPADPKAAARDDADQKYGAASKTLFEQLSALSPGADPMLFVMAKATRAMYEHLPGAGGAGEAAPDAQAGAGVVVATNAIDYYRVKYGLTPQNHAVQIARAFRKWDLEKDTSANPMDKYGSSIQHNRNETTPQEVAGWLGVPVELVAGAVKAPPANEVPVIDETNRMLVKPDFDAATATSIANQMWKVLHEGGEVHLIETTLYGMYNPEEQRLIRLAFRQLSGGIDWQFYVQQAKYLSDKSVADDTTANRHGDSAQTMVGGEGTAAGQDVTGGNTVVKVVANDGELDALNEVATKGNLDICAQIRSSLSHDHVKDIFRIVDRASDDQCRKVLGDQQLMDQLQSKLDKYAWDRVYRTLSGQDDLAVRLESRSHGDYDSGWSKFWGSTDKEGMKDEVHAYVERMREKFLREAAADAGHKDGPTQEDAMQAELRLREACRALAANPEVNAILETELSGAARETTRGLIIGGGKESNVATVAGNGSDDDTLAEIKRMRQGERQGRLADPEYMTRLQKQLSAANFQVAVSLLQSTAKDNAQTGTPGEVQDHLADLIKDAGKERPDDDDVLRDLAQLTQAEHARLIADPAMTAKVMAAFTYSSETKRAIAAQICGYDGAKKQDELVQSVGKLSQGRNIPPPEQERLAFLVDNAIARIRQGNNMSWNRLLAQLVEVYKMDFSPKLVDPNAPAKPDPAAPPDVEGAKVTASAAASIEGQLRKQVWLAVTGEIENVDHWAVARKAVLHEPGGDPSALRVAEQEGHLTTDRDGIADTISNASDDLLIESWTSIAKPKPDGGGTFAEAYDQYLQAKTAAGGEKKESSPQQEALHAAKLHFMGYVITESEDFEQDVLKHVSGWFDDDKSTQATADGKPDLTKARDNDHYNKVRKILRDRIPMLPPDKIAAKLGVTDPTDIALIDNPNRRVETTVHTETDEYLRKFGTIGGGMRVANAERATVNDTMERLGQEGDTALTKTDKDGQYGVASAEDAAKVQKTAGDLERAMREFSTARAKIAMIAAAIVSTVVAVLVTVLTGGAGAGLGYMLVAGAITGAAAAAGSELTKSAIQGSDYDKSGALLNIAEGALTGMVFAGTMKIAEGAMDGLFGAKELAEQGAAMSKAVKTWPAAFKDFGMGTLRSGSEMVLAQGMNEAIMTGLAPLDPSLWVHGWNEGVYNARHVVREKMSEFGDHMVSAAVTGVLMHGAGTALSAGKKGLGIKSEEIIPTGPQYKKVESTLQRVFDAQRIKNNAMRYLQVDSMLVQAFASFVSNRITGGPIDWDNVPDSLFQEFIGAVQGMSTQVITGYYRPWQKAAAAGESPRAATREEELKQHGHELRESERENYKTLNPDDGKAPAVSIEDYIAARKEIIDARLLDWQTKNRPLTPEERAAFEAWCRDAKDTADLQKRAATSPLEVDAVKAVSPKGTAAKPADATAQQAPKTGPGGESMADQAAKLTGTVHAIEGTGFDGSARGESAPQKVQVDIVRALPAIIASAEPGTIKQVGERVIVVQVGASTLTIELATMTVTSNEPGRFRFIGPDMARIELSDQLRDQEVERTLADLLAQTRAAREAQLAGKPMVTETALGADAKGKELSVEDRGRVAQLKDLVTQLGAASGDEAAKKDPAAADRLGKELDDVLRAMKITAPEGVKHLEELGAGLTRAEQNALVVRLDAPRRQAAAKDLGPHPGTELHNHFLGVVDPTSFADATKMQEAAKAKAEGRAPSTKSGWELTLDQIAGMDKLVNNKTGKPSLAHSKDGKAVGRGETFDTRGTSGDAIAIANQTKAVIEGQAVSLKDPPEWLTKGASELEALNAQVMVARNQEGSDTSALEKQIADKKAALAQQAVRTALTATEETDFNSAYEVRDELIKSQMGGPKGAELRSELVKEKAKEPADPARIKSLEKQIEGAAYEDFARQTVDALVKDGLTYNEQSNSIKKLNEKFTKPVMDRVIWEECAKMLANGEINEAQVIQLRELTMTLTGFFGEEETRADEGGDARNKDRKAGKGQFGDKGWSNPEPAKGEQLGQKEQIKEQLETRVDVMGVDIAGPETARFDDIGQGRFTDLYEVIREAAIKRNRPLVLRPHVGEGFTDTEAGNKFNKNESKRKGNEAAHYDRARQNLQALLDTLQQLKNKGKLDPEHVVIRFGHATHADAAQVEQMASLGIVAEVNLESNVATGSLDQRNPETGKSFETESFEDHALLGYVLVGNETILSTDAHSVMGTNMTEEYGRAQRIIEEFLAGKSYVEVTEARAKGRGQRIVVNPGTPYERVEYRLHVGDLDATELEKFTKGYEKLNEFGRDYQKKVAQQDKGDKLLWKELFDLLKTDWQTDPGTKLHVRTLLDRLALTGGTLDETSIQFAETLDKAGTEEVRVAATKLSLETTAKVGVRGTEVPDQIPRLKNLPPEQAAAEKRFAEAYEKDPEAMAKQYLELVKSGQTDPEKKNFATDDAKLLSPDYNKDGATEPEKLKARGMMNLAVHQTANAVAKLAFTMRLDEIAADPGASKLVLCTAGGVGAGKSYSIDNNPEALALKQKSSVVWDSAGEQNSTELGWVIAQAKQRGLEVAIVYVHRLPQQSWENMKFGVIPRAQKSGRMVDARLHADSYAEGARNFDAIQKSVGVDPSVKFVIIDATGDQPKQLDELPPSALNLNADEIAARNVEFLKQQQGLPDHVKQGGQEIGDKVWGEANSRKNELVDEVADKHGLSEQHAHAASSVPADAVFSEAKDGQRISPEQRRRQINELAEMIENVRKAAATAQAGPTITDLRPGASGQPVTLVAVLETEVGLVNGLHDAKVNLQSAIDSNAPQQTIENLTAAVEFELRAYSQHLVMRKGDYVRYGDALNLNIEFFRRYRMIVGHELSLREIADRRPSNGELASQELRTGFEGVDTTKELAKQLNAENAAAVAQGDKTDVSLIINTTKKGAKTEAQGMTDLVDAWQKDPELRKAVSGIDSAGVESDKNPPADLWKPSAVRAFMNAEIVRAELSNLPSGQRAAFVQTLATVAGTDAAAAEALLVQFEAAPFARARDAASAIPATESIAVKPDGSIDRTFEGLTIEGAARQTREIANALRAHRANIGDTTQLPNLLGYTVHAGEQVREVDPFELLRQVEQAVDLGADRIGHGLILSIDPTLLIRMKKENPSGKGGLAEGQVGDFAREQAKLRSHVKAAGVTVETNITSNTEMANLTTSEQPAPKMIEQGLRVSVSTDNETTLSTTVKAELKRLSEAPSVSRVDVAIVMLEGFYSRMGGRELADRAQLKSQYAEALVRGLNGEQLADLASRLAARFYVNNVPRDPRATIGRVLDAVFGGGG